MDLHGSSKKKKNLGNWRNDGEKWRKRVAQRVVKKIELTEGWMDMMVGWMNNTEFNNID